ncbi:molecular chaperone [Pseudescherichia vulneris]
MTTKISTLLFASFLASSSIAQAGVVVGGTRVIYDGGKKEASIGLENPDSSPYLIQSWVENEAGQSDKSRFIVTPPLFRLDGNQKNTLRIMQANGALANDRETLYWLNIKSIPTADPSRSDNTLQLAVNTRIKLIYRPQALKNSTPENASSALKWTRQGDRLSVNNPTPYYINFQSVSLNGRPLEKVTYVAPHATAFFPLQPDARGNQIEWKVISDYGAVGAVHKTSL